MQNFDYSVDPIRLIDNSYIFFHSFYFNIFSFYQCKICAYIINKEGPITSRIQKYIKIMFCKRLKSGFEGLGIWITYYIYMIWGQSNPHGQLEMI